MINSNKPVSPIMTKRRLYENPANKMNNMGGNKMYKPMGRNNAHVNRVKNNSMRNKTGSSYSNLFNF